MSNCGVTLAVGLMADGAGTSAMRRRQRRLRSWLRHERQTVAMELAAALHHSRDVGPGTHAGLRAQKAASSREEAGVETHNALRGLKTLPPGMRPEQLPEAPGPQRCDRTVRGTSVGAPVLAVQSLRGFDGVDDTAAKFLLRQALKKKEEEEEDWRLSVAKRNEEEKEERRMKRINEMLRLELPVSSEEREAWRRWIASSSSSSSGKRRKRKRRRKRKVPKSSSSCSSRSSRVARAARTQNSGHYFRARCLVRQWIHFLTSILVAFGATPGTRQSFVRCWVLLRSRRTMVFWEMTQCFRISVMLGTTVDTILRQSTWFLLAPCFWQSPVLCLTRHSATLVVDSGGGMCLLILLVLRTSHCIPFYCSQAYMLGIMAGMNQKDSYAATQFGFFWEMTSWSFSY